MSFKKSEKYWVDKKKLNDPMFWFMKASYFSSTAELLIGELSKYDPAGLHDIPGNLFNAINTIPYLTGLSSELYMKGYLVYKGNDPYKLREKGHNLQKLREMCLKCGDKRFQNDNLMFLTDTLGEHLMDDGGIRYPDKENMAIYGNKFKKALECLQEITSGISDKLVRPAKNLAVLF